MAGGGATPGEQRPGELRVVGTSVAREIDLVLDRVAQSVGKRAPRILQVGSRTLVADRASADYYEAVAKGRDAKLACNWVTTDLFGHLNRDVRRLRDSVYDSIGGWKLDN